MQNVNRPMPNWNHYLQRVIELMKRYPGLIAVFGFFSGVGSFILVDRQPGTAGCCSRGPGRSGAGASWLLLEG